MNKAKEIIGKAIIAILTCGSDTKVIEEQMREFESLIRADERKVALTNLLESIEARMAEVREIIKYTNPDSASSFGGQLIAYAIVVQAIRKAVAG